MPGIIGVIEKARLPNPSLLLQEMVKCMGKDAALCAGTFSATKLRAHIGWVSRKESSDCLPLWNEAGNVCLLFSGETFSDHTTNGAPKRVENASGLNNANSPLDLYEELGQEFVGHLNGVFSGVLLDLRENKLLLFNGRYGLGRVYFHENDQAFYFASEAKALLKVVPALRAIDPTGLAEFFSCGHPLDNRTLFSGIRLMPGGSVWTWNADKKTSRHAYFDPTIWENQPTLSSEQFYDRLKEVFTRIVPRYFSGPQPVAMSITGGLDSRMIMAAMKPQPGSLKCYTFGGMYRDSADVKIGRSLAQTCGQSFKVLPLTPDFFAQFPDLAAEAVRRTDGAMDVTGAAGLYLNRLARDIAPVRMTGNYGGEILRGIAGLKVQRVDESLFEPGFVRHLRNVPDTIATARRVALPSFIAFKQLPWVHFAMLALEQSEVTVRTPYLDNELVALSYQAPPQLWRNKNVAFRYIADLDPRLARLPNDRGAAWKPGIDLNHPRSRLQYLREEFLPKSEYLFDYGMPTWLARIDRLLSPLRLERLFLGNQKFCHFRTWYRRELSGFVREILLDPRTLSRPYLNRRRVEQVVSSHVKGRANFTLTINKLLSCELVHRTLLDK